MEENHLVFIIFGHDPHVAETNCIFKKTWLKKL